MNLPQGKESTESCWILMGLLVYAYTESQTYAHMECEHSLYLFTLGMQNNTTEFLVFPVDMESNK